jgi:DNA replication protein DnaC
LAVKEIQKRLKGSHLEILPVNGKSHLSTALGVAAVKAGKCVYRCTLAELMEALTRAERESRLVEKIRFYSRASLLIIPRPTGHA